MKNNSTLQTLTAAQIQTISNELSGPPPVTAPVISSFTANPASVTSGLSSTLSWSMSGGAPTALSIDNGVGSVLGLTSRAVTPGATTTYTLTASNSAGSVTKSTTVTVTSPLQAPQPPESPQPQPPTVDLKNWSGQWLKVTIKYDGYFFGQSNSGVSTEPTRYSPGMDKDHENIGAYLKFGPGIRINRCASG